MRVFAWPALAEEDHVVRGEQRVLELREDGFLVADDALDDGFARRDAGDGVLADLLLDRARHPAARAQLAEGSGTTHGAPARAPHGPRCTHATRARMSPSRGIGLAFSQVLTSQMRLKQHVTCETAGAGDVRSGTAAARM